MINIFKKKRDANVIDGMLLTLINILMMATLFAALVDTTILLNYGKNIDQVARKYILMLETKGTVNKNSVINDIDKLGFTNCEVVINDGKAYTIPYGEPVSIEITVYAQPRELELFGSNLLGQDIYTCKRKRTSISKAR